MNKNVFFKLLSLTMIIAIFGCNKNESDDDSVNDYSNQDAQYEEKLTGTSWKQEKFVWGENGENVNRHNGIMTFGYDHNYYIIGLDGKYDAKGTWSVKDGIIETTIKYNNSGMTDATFRLSVLFYSGYTLDRISFLTDYHLRLLWINDDESFKYWQADYYKVSYQ